MARAIFLKTVDGENQVFKVGLFAFWVWLATSTIHRFF